LGVLEFLLLDDLDDKVFVGLHLLGLSGEECVHEGLEDLEGLLLVVPAEFNALHFGLDAQDAREFGGLELADDGIDLLLHTLELLLNAFVRAFIHTERLLFGHQCSLLLGGHVAVFVALLKTLLGLLQLVVFALELLVLLLFLVLLHFEFLDALFLLFEHLCNLLGLLLLVSLVVVVVLQVVAEHIDLLLDFLVFARELLVDAGDLMYAFVVVVSEVLESE